MTDEHKKLQKELMRLMSDYLSKYPNGKHDLAGEFEVSPDMIGRWASGKNFPHPILAKLIITRLVPIYFLHHDDPPCEARLDEDGFCSACKLHPDMQSKCFYPYCPGCGCKLEKMKCPECGCSFSLSAKR